MKTGNYVRTKNGIIGKLQIEKENIAVANWNGDYELEEITKYIINNNRININEIVKSSLNIIDLIKKKDIVIDYKGNIYQVVKVWKGYVFTDKKNEYGQVITLVDYQIKSIVTKEQFEQIEYKIGGSDV